MVKLAVEFWWKMLLTISPSKRSSQNLLPNFARSSPTISPKTSPTSLWKSLVLTICEHKGTDQSARTPICGFLWFCCGVRKRVVLADVPLCPKPEWGYNLMFPCNKSGLSKRCFWQTVILLGWHPPFSSFSSISGVRGAKSLVFVGRMQYQNFRQFSSKPPVFGRGRNDRFFKTTVSTTLNKNRNEGPFAKTTFLRNRPFVSCGFCERGTVVAKMITELIRFEPEICVSVIEIIWNSGKNLYL